MVVSVFFEPAQNSQPSGGAPESRRAAENGSNRDSSEAVRSGSGTPPGIYFGGYQEKFVPEKHP